MVLTIMPIFSRAVWTITNGRKPRYGGLPLRQLPAKTLQNTWQQSSTHDPHRVSLVLCFIDQCTSAVIMPQHMTIPPNAQICVAENRGANDFEAPSVHFGQ